MPRRTRKAKSKTLLYSVRMKTAELPMDKPNGTERHAMMPRPSMTLAFRVLNMLPTDRKRGFRYA
jgi:hypothetical protein